MRDRHMKVRTLYPPFVAAVERYFDKLLPLVEDLQVRRDFLGGLCVQLGVVPQFSVWSTVYVPWCHMVYKYIGIETSWTWGFWPFGQWALPPPPPCLFPGLCWTLLCFVPFNTVIQCMWWSVAYALLMLSFAVWWFRIVVWNSENRSRDLWFLLYFVSTFDVMHVVIGVVPCQWCYLTYLVTGFLLRTIFPCLSFAVSN